MKRKTSFPFALSALNRTFEESSLRLNNKNKKVFVLYCLRLAVPLDKVLSLDNEKKNKFSFCFVLA